MFDDFFYKVRSGIKVTWKSIKLLISNLILLLYGVPFLIVSALLPQIKNPCIVITGASIIFTFFNLCLARHAMHLKRHQPASFRETLTGIWQLRKQIIRWTALVTIYWLMLSMFNIYLSALGLIAYLAVALVTPIIATEPISIIRAVKRSLHVIWLNLVTFDICIGATIGSIVLLFGVLITIFNYTNPSILLANIVINTLGSASFSFITTTFTLFYYEFYVKRELELAEVFATRM